MLTRRVVVFLLSPMVAWANITCGVDVGQCDHGANKVGASLLQGRLNINNNVPAQWGWVPKIIKKAAKGAAKATKKVGKTMKKGVKKIGSWVKKGLGKVKNGFFNKVQKRFSRIDTEKKELDQTLSQFPSALSKAENVLLENDLSETDKRALDKLKPTYIKMMVACKRYEKVKSEIKDMEKGWTGLLHELESSDSSLIQTQKMRGLKGRLNHFLARQAEVKKDLKDIMLVGMTHADTALGKAEGVINRLMPHRQVGGSTEDFDYDFNSNKKAKTRLKDLSHVIGTLRGKLSELSGTLGQMF